MSNLRAPGIGSQPLWESAGACLVRTGRRVRNALRDLIASQSSWRRRKRFVDSEFDREHSVATGGICHLSELNVDRKRGRLGVSHIAIDPEEMQAALASLEIDHRRFSFVDLGSGKGRAILIASLLPFRRIVGVEFAPELHAQSVTNAASFAHPGQRCTNIELQCMDAATFEFPAQPLVLFMYNPFGPEVMMEVVTRVLDSLAREPREFYVLYANPFHIGVWIRAGFVEKVRGDTFSLLVAPVGASALTDAPVESGR
jgi:SAM-dependent methyltransferase